MGKAKKLYFFGLVIMVILLVALCAQKSQSGPEKPKDATKATAEANAKWLEELPFNNKEDFDFADRGFIGGPESLVIKGAKGNVVWDMDSYASYIADDKKAPDTVNPSLWRNAQLCMKAGLYKVTDRIYQVRGYDLSNITFVQGNKGWIVFDPLISAEPATASYDLVTQHLGKKPIHTIIYSHTHVDHYGGIRGIIDEADVKAGKVKIIAPEEFMEHAISENVTAGNAMARRAVYMYGAMLPRNEKGSINGGLGQTVSMGDVTLIEPTDYVTKTGQEITVDGIKMVFQMTPGGEAPAEMNTYFPQLKALWLAENNVATLHNLYTPRGAQVRDGLKWASWMDEAIDLYGKEAEVVFQSHHWPRWGNAVVVDYMKKERDMYKYIHDQSVRLLNHGYNMTEIAEMIVTDVPPEIGKQWYNRGYYGTVKHNAKAVYQKYLGFFDGNPANWDPLPPEPAAKKFVEYMGGANAVISRARKDFAKGEYRWVAQVVNQVVFADPDNKEARELCADALEQMGYQSESGVWRNFYLQGAFELRNGVPSVGGTVTASPDTIRAMPPYMLFDYLAVRLNGPKAAGKKIVLNMDFIDLKEQYVLTVENGVLNYAQGRQDDKADATITLSKATLDAIQLKEATLEEKLESGDVKISGRKEALVEFLGLLDTFSFWFNIVTS